MFSMLAQREVCEFLQYLSRMIQWHIFEQLEITGSVFVGNAD